MGNLCEFDQIFSFLLALTGKKFYTLINVPALGYCLQRKQ